MAERNIVGQSIAAVRALNRLVLQLGSVINLLEGSTMNDDELALALEAAADKTDKIVAEVTAATAALQAALAASGQTTPAIDAALARLQGSLTIADDLNPDTGALVAP